MPLLLPLIGAMGSWQRNGPDRVAWDPTSSQQAEGVPHRKEDTGGCSAPSRLLYLDQATKTVWRVERESKSVWPNATRSLTQTNVTVMQAHPNAPTAAFLPHCTNLLVVHLLVVFMVWIVGISVDTNNLVSSNGMHVIFFDRLEVCPSALMKCRHKQTKEPHPPERQIE